MVAKKLIDDIFMRHGVPRKLISDNGVHCTIHKSCYIVMQYVLYCFEIKPKFTPVKVLNIILRLTQSRDDIVI